MADKAQFDKVVLYNGETNDVTPVVLSKNVDYATHGFPPATEKQFTSEGIRILRPPVYSGPRCCSTSTNSRSSATSARDRPSPTRSTATTTGPSPWPIPARA